MGENAPMMLPPARPRKAVHGPRSTPRGGTLRIIGGSLRGSRLAVPERPGLRPTPDRLRETLFNWLMPWIEGARCLDLYAGTGALGIEALSRGAASCVFVERDPGLADALRANLARLRAAGGEVVQGDALDYLRNAPACRFDIAFIDPPFDADAWAAALAALEDSGVLADGALVHVESPREVACAVPPDWQLHRQGHAGEVGHALYRRAKADPLS
ncbi:MAG: 16S rRNA (guanine(966)-N(2))-methyltransferase RsmD [Xanthomonadales bacterium]|nr:16S rRNA (guanine(966)-N(2))-methyltransferase RsmD [Xanthomonadales bacterium]